MMGLLAASWRHHLYRVAVPVYSCFRHSLRAYFRLGGDPGSVSETGHLHEKQCLRVAHVLRPWP